MMSFLDSVITTVLAFNDPLVPTQGEGTFWMPESASTQAPFVDHVFDFITVLSYFFQILITVILVWFAIKYRKKKGQDNFNDDGPIHNTALELTWTLVPLFLVIGIFYIGMAGFLDLRRAPDSAYEVSVTAQKWSWSFDHPEYGVNQAGVVTVPVGRPVEFLMTSADVLHSCFVPAFRVKQDVVPGRYSRLWFEATKPGVYQLYCTEYCGRDHSKMLALVEVLPEDEFQAAMGKLATEYMDLPEQDLPAYALDRLYNRCSSCHSLDGSAVVGPSFKGLWERTKTGETVFKDGRRLADLMGPGKQFEQPEDYIRDSILVPQSHIVQNYTGAMPSFQGQLKERQVLSLVLMMKYLDRLVDDQGNRIESPDLNELDPGAGDPESSASDGDAENGTDAQVGTGKVGSDDDA